MISIFTSILCLSQWHSQEQQQSVKTRQQSSPAAISHFQSSRCSDNFNNSGTHNPSGLQMQITDQRQKAAASNKPPHKCHWVAFTLTLLKKIDLQVPDTDNANIKLRSVFLLSSDNTHFKPRLSSNSSRWTQTTTYWIPDQPEMIKWLITCFPKGFKIVILQSAIIATAGGY